MERAGRVAPSIFMGEGGYSAPFSSGLDS